MSARKNTSTTSKAPTYTRKEGKRGRPKGSVAPATIVMRESFDRILAPVVTGKAPEAYVTPEDVGKAPGWTGLAVALGAWAKDRGHLIRCVGVVERDDSRIVERRA